MPFRDGFRHDIARAECGINGDSGLVREGLTAPERVATTPCVHIDDVEVVGCGQIHGRGDRVLGCERIPREPSGTDFTSAASRNEQCGDQDTKKMREPIWHLAMENY